jgi:hypothetical protein
MNMFSIIDDDIREVRDLPLELGNRSVERSNEDRFKPPSGS